MKLEFCVVLLALIKFSLLNGAYKVVSQKYVILIYSK